jgi:IS5 family transposase
VLREGPAALVVGGAAARGCTSSIATSLATRVCAERSVTRSAGGGLPDRAGGAGAAPDHAGQAGGPRGTRGDRPAQCRAAGQARQGSAAAGAQAAGGHHPDPVRLHPAGEDERGFIADHQLEQGNPPDAAQLVPAVERVVQLTCRVPGTVVGDRGFGSAANDSALAQLGVARIGLQRNGTRGKARRALERTRAFRRMRNWRVGIEARISHLKRGFGLRRARLRRLAGARTWVGLGVLAYNLQRMTVTAR